MRSWSKLAVGAALVVLLFTLTACEELFMGDGGGRRDPDPPPPPPPVRPEPEVAAPTFGGLSVPDQLYKRGEAIAPIALPVGYHGNGSLSYGFSVPGSVPGLSFSAGTRELSGTPTAAGRYAATYTVTDGAGDSESLNFTITVTDVTGTLDVQSDPAGASIHLNAVDTGLLTPAVFEVPAGGHEVMMAKPGFVPVLSTVQVSAGERVQVSGTFDYASGVDPDDEPDVPVAPDDLPPLVGSGRLVTAASESVDWSRFFPAVGYQGNAPSCAYFATAYLASYMVTYGNHISNGTDAIANMSPGFLWTVEPPRAGFRGSFDRLKRYGISSESMAPYRDHVTCWSSKDDDYENDEDCWDAPTEQAKQQALKYKTSMRKIQGITTQFGLYSSVHHRNRKFRRALHQGYAIILSIRSCNLEDKAGEYPYLWGREETKGCSFNWNDYHGVVLVGYDNNKGPRGAFKFINSWGDTWGDDGYGWIGYDIPTSFIGGAYIMYPPYDPWPPIPDPAPYFPVGAQIPDQTYTVGSRIGALTLLEASGGSGRLNYRLRPRLPSGLSFNSSTRTLTGTPATGSAGTYEMTYTATDPDNTNADTNTSAPLLFTITVQNASEPPDPPDPPTRTGGKMYWTDWGTGKIERANLDGSGRETVITYDQPDGIAISGGKMYWIDFSVSRVNTIQRANLDGSGRETLVRIGRQGQRTGLRTPRGTSISGGGIAIFDGKMYWTEYVSGYSDEYPVDLEGTIQRANLDGSGLEWLITTGRNPGGIALSGGSGGKMYWTEPGTIERANLDGSGRETLVTGSTEGGITIFGGKMYWTGSWSTGVNTIERADLDGSGRETLISTGLRDSFGIAIFGGKMYWTDAGTSTIERANLDGSGRETLISTGLRDPGGIVLVASPVPPVPPLRWSGTVQDQTYTVSQRITPLTLPEATGGSGRRNYRLRVLGDWPLGLSFDSSTRRLTGTPRAGYDGTYNMRYTATDAVDTSLTATLSFTITVRPAPLRWLRTGEVADQTYTVGQRIRALRLPEPTGGSGGYSFGLVGTPPGISVTGSPRQLTGTPTKAGNYTLTWTVTDRSDGSSISSTFMITVLRVSDRWSGAVADQTYTVGQRTTPLTLPTLIGGDPPVVYALSPAVPGLTFNSSTRTLSGTPTRSGTYSMTYTAADFSLDSVSLRFTITVR